MIPKITKLANEYGELETTVDVYDSYGDWVGMAVFITDAAIQEEVLFEFARRLKTVVEARQNGG